MAAPTWIEYGERATADNDPIYGTEGIVNRPTRELWSNFIIEHNTDGTHTAGTAIPTGTIFETARRTAPTGWLLLADGAAVSRSTYADLFAAIVPSLGTFTVTIATPGVISLTDHGFVAGDTFYTTTTGALPSGMAANTLYYVLASGLTSSSFQFAATLGGSAINTTGTQSGTHTLRACPYGLGDGSTTFNLPKRAGRVGVGQGAGSGLTVRNLGATGGEESHVLLEAELAAHTHSVGGVYTNYSAGAHTGGASSQDGFVNNTSTISGTTGSGTAHNTMQPYSVSNFIIKT